MKKILALALAATTAFSMFGSSLSASAIDYMDETAFLNDYNATSVTISANKITVSQPVADKDGNVAETKTYEITERQDLLNFAQHIVLGDTPSGAPQSYEAWKAWSGQGAADNRYGMIYMYDYALDKNVENDDAYESALNDFKDYVNQLKNPQTNGSYSIERLFSYWKEAYRTSPEVNVLSGGTSNVRWSAINDAKLNSNNVRQYMTYDSNKNPIPDMTQFDPQDAADYNVYPLITAVYNLGRNESVINSSATSRIVYINKEYTRVIDEVSFADTTNAMDDYYELLSQINEYKESDYTASAWRDVQSYVEKAEAAAKKAVTVNDWEKALKYLKNADAVSAKAVDYSAMQTALMSLYADANGKTKVSYIEKAPPQGNGYVGVGGNYLYQKSDFKVRNGYSDEWNNFAVDTFKSNSSSNPVVDEYSAYSWASKLYYDARNSNGNVKQSQLDKALEDLNEAVDALTATNSVDEWRIVKLQGLVDKAAGFQESDFNTSSRKWTTFVNALDSAEKTLAKANPSSSELDRVTNSLDTALTDIKSSAKSVPSATKDELKDTIKEADKLIANVSTQTGAQVAALREASDDAADVYSRIGISGKDKAVISEVEGAIADLKEAIVNFNNPQGWNKVDGKWYYGEGAENYKGDWYKIGATWFMFNDDGSLKVSEWFQRDGKWYWANENGGLAVGWAKVDGKWYFFKGNNAMKTGWEKVDNNWYYLSSSGAMVTGWNWINGKCYYFYNSGAMAANTTIGGYKVDANGAWIA